MRDTGELCPFKVMDSCSRARWQTRSGEVHECSSKWWGRVLAA